VATPTVRMKLRDVWCIAGSGEPYRDFWGTRHDSSLASNSPVMMDMVPTVHAA